MHRVRKLLARCGRPATGGHWAPTALSGEPGDPWEKAIPAEIHVAKDAQDVSIALPKDKLAQPTIAKMRQSQQPAVSTTVEEQWMPTRSRTRYGASGSDDNVVVASGIHRRRFVLHLRD